MANKSVSNQPDCGKAISASDLLAMLKDPLGAVPVRYAISSVAAFVVDYFLLLVFERIFSHSRAAMELAAVIAFAFSSQVNFHINRLWVFKSNKSVWAEMGGYYALAAISFTVKTFVLMELMVRALLIPTWIAKPIAEVIMFFINFIVQKKLIFFKKSRD